LRTAYRRPRSRTKYRHYVAAGNGKVILIRTSTGASPTYYVTTDHLGSSAVITDGTGALVATENFPAFGCYHRGDDWSGTNTTAEQNAIAAVTRRGFTGHEMMDNLGLVNMNGRTYGGYSFLSADPYVAYPGNTQSYNRYSYVMNAAVTFVDPTGFGSVTCDKNGENCEVTVEASRLPPVSFDLVSGDELAELDRTPQVTDWSTVTNSKPMLHPGDGGSGGDGDKSAPQSLRQRICSSLDSPNSTRGTLQLGVAATGDAGPLAGTAGFGLAVDTHGNIALYGFLGGGTGAGLSGVAGGSVQVSNAYDVSDLSDLFANGSVTVGAGAAGTVDGFRGPSAHGWVTGGGATLGAGGGGSAFAGGTYTKVANLFNLTNVAKGIFGCGSAP